RQGGTELASLPFRAGEAPRQVQAAHCAFRGETTVETREAAARGAGGLPQAGGDPRRRTGGGVARRRGDAAAGDRMTLVFMEGAEDELSRQALTFAKSLGGDVRAVTVDGPYAPAAW